VEFVASLSQGRTAAAQCGLFTHKSVLVIFEPPCVSSCDNIFVFLFYVNLFLCYQPSCDNYFYLSNTF